MPPKKVKQSVNPNLLSILKAQKNPPIQPDLLQKVTEDEILSLDAEDAEQFWKDMNLNFKVHLKILIPEEPLQEEGRKEKNKVDDSLDFMKSVLNLLDQKANTADHYIPVIAVQMLIVLNGLILNSVFDEQLKIQTVKLCETWWKKNLIFRETLGENTIHYLLLKSLQNGAPKNVISRVCALRESLKENFHLERYLDIFSQISQNHSYLSSKDGQSFLGFIMALDQRIVRCIHESAKLFLVNNKKTAAVGYGRVYYLAWHSASGNLKKVIEDKCIQEFMEHIFTAHRQGLELSQLGQNIFVILREFHSHKIMSHVRTMLTDLYEPLLWRYLRSSNNIYRCNAAQVLFDVYPLERPGEGREEGLQLILKQHQIMDELLSDEYHVVRLIAVKGVCRILSEYWEVIPQNTIQRWMKIMTHNLVNDGSYPNVRQNVYIGFKYLINKPMSVEYMQQLLPELQNHFHDANAKVRAAFVDMLIACKENGIKYWNIVPLTHLLRRLEVEETEVGCLIVKLLFNSFYLYERGPHVTFKRIMNLILMNRNASRCFFLYSKPSLNTDRAIQLMISILVYMLQHVNTKLGITTKEGSNESQPPQKKKQKASSNRHNKNRNSSQSNESMETTAAEEIAARNADIYSEASLDNPIISLGFIEIVVILWKIHAADFNEAENKDQSKKFYNVCVHCLPTFLKYYKDTDVYTSLLFLCGVMPLSVMKVIRPLCNIESICLSQLKALTMDSSDEEILRLVQPLCFWNHGDNILETARLWIDDAFRIDDLNATFCKPRSEKRRVKIKDIHEPKPLLGFRLLNTIFSFAPNTEVILTKNYNHVLELWKYLERIMILIENRIRNGEPYEHSLLCDEFIEECFSRYLKLILHLKRKSEDNTFDACKAVTDVIDWAERCLIPVLPVENPLIEESSKIEWLVIETSGPLLVKLLNEILKISRNLIAFYHGNIDYYSKVIKFTKKVLSTGCKIKFVYSAMGLILQFCNNDYISQLDKRQLFKVLMPLFNLCIDSFTDIVYSKDNINRYVESFRKLKNVISTFLMKSLKRLSLSSCLFKDTTRKFVDVMVIIISKDLETLEFIHTVKKLQDLPYITAQFAQLFINKKDLCELFITMLCKNFKMKYSKVPKLSASALGLLHVLTLCERRISLQVLSSAVKNVEDDLNSSEITDSNDSVDNSNEINFASISRNLIKDMKKFMETKSSKSRVLADGIEGSSSPKIGCAIGLNNSDVVQFVPSQMTSPSKENVEQTESSTCKDILVDDNCKAAGISEVNLVDDNYKAAGISEVNLVDDNCKAAGISEVNESCLESSQLSMSFMTKKRKLYSSNSSSLIIPEDEQGINDINKSVSGKSITNHFTNPVGQQIMSGSGANTQLNNDVSKSTSNNSGLGFCNNHQQNSSFVVQKAISNISILSPRNNSVAIEKRINDVSDSNCISEKQLCLSTTTNNNEDSSRRKSSPYTSGTRKSLRIASHNATGISAHKVGNESTNLTSLKTTDKDSNSENNDSVTQTSFVSRHKRKLFSPKSKAIESIQLNFSKGDVNTRDATDSIAHKVRNESKNLTSHKTTEKVSNSENNDSVNQTSFVSRHKRKLFSPKSKGIESIQLNFSMGDVNTAFNGTCSMSNTEEPLAKKSASCSALTKMSRNERCEKQSIKKPSENSSLDVSGIMEIDVDLNASNNPSNEIGIITRAREDKTSGKEVSFVEKRNDLIKSPLSTNKLHQRTKSTSFPTSNRKSDQSNRKRRSSVRISDSHTRNMRRS